MKTLLLGSVALIALVSAANAADLSPKTYTKAPPTAPVSNWTGFYLSAGGGYGMWASDQQTTQAGTQSIVERSGGRGYFGTVSGGYDYQFNWLNSTWVAGIFADAQFGDIKGTFNSAIVSGATKNDLNYAVGARVGYLIAPNALSYINAGYSHADFSGSVLTTAFTPGAEFTTSRFHRDGWFLGGGVENSLDIFGISAPGWFTKTEYRVAEYGNKNVDLIYSGIFAGTTSFKPYVQTVSTSLVYRFNSQVASGRTVASAPIYTKAPASASNWTGFYLSGGGGYGLWEADQHTTFAGIALTPQRMGGRGYFGTVGGGYDYQFNWLNSTWVAGIFADAQFGDIKGTFNAVEAAGTTKNSLNYAIGARVGYLVAPNVLSYANVGYSHADFTGAGLIPVTGGPVVINTPKLHRDGWFLGGGVENSLDIFGISAPGWFTKTEYRVAEYGSKNVDLIVSGIPLGTTSFKPYVQTVSTSLVYRFNWSGAPVTAKY